MSLSLDSSRRKFRAIIGIIYRNVFILTNGIIFCVAILLIIFGDIEGGVFLGLITLLNMILGCVQEISAFLTLEKLQLLITPRVIRINQDNTESTILAEEIKERDRIKLKIGDQVPCDGALVSSHGFEVNEALITGESNAFLKKPSDKIFAGSIVTSGSGVLRVDKIFAESRIAMMTKSIKKYSLVLSPIQYSINLFIKYISYVLLLIIAFVASRGLLVHESTVNIIQNVGALTSVLLPQGMVVVVTLLFSYGAVHLFRRNVLLQEVNATEKIGRIENLCMDKTGTLTDNNLVVEHIYLAPGVDEKTTKESVIAYIKNTGDSSQTIKAVEKEFPNKYGGTIIDDLTFSSSRQFGAVHIKDDFGERVVLAGGPDIFLSCLKDEKEKEWVQKFIDTEAKMGKRIICFVQSSLNILPKDLSGIELKILSVFILNNSLREGVKKSVQFFQDRGVIIRLISGDNTETVRAVAISAGVNNPNAVIAGPELDKWTNDDFLKNVPNYTLFTRIKPEQKEKIIEVLKHSGFTAMIGDGANDALAIKKADLGIAMFEGAQATRQVASIVLIKNSFADLPGGVKLADSIIQNIEICASIFFNQVFLGFFFFIALATTGHTFPFTPLNITFVNYFTIGLPTFLIFYWILRPVHVRVAKDNKSFLKQVIPFALISAIPQAIVIIAAFYDSLENVKTHGPTSLVVLSLIILGVLFFMYTPSVYAEPASKAQKIQFISLIIIEFISIIIFLKIPFIAGFYDLKVTSLHSLIELTPLVIMYAFVQYGITKKFFAVKLQKNNLLSI